MGNDIEKIRQETSLSDLAMDFGVDLRKNGNEFEACCPLHEENTPSFTIFTGQDGVERFHCFGCQERGDVIDFVKAIKGVETGAAIKILGGEASRPNVERRKVEVRDPYEGIAPIWPDEAIEVGKRVSLYNPKRAGTEREWGSFAPSMVFPYHHKGRLYGYVLRHDFPNGGKETPMVMRVRLPDGKAIWSRFPFPKPRPLYRGHTLDQGGQVIIVEGEKCADALARVTRRQSVSWCGGSYGINHTDWTQLAGRKVVIWPDADEPGMKTAGEIARMLTDLDCSVKVMDVMPTDKPKGWDVADAEADGWGKVEVETFMRDTARPWPFEPTPDPEPKLRTYEQAEIMDPPPPEPEPGDFDYAGPDELHEVSRDNRPGLPGLPPIEDRTDGSLVVGGEPERLREWVFMTYDSLFKNARTGDTMNKTSFDLAMSPVTPRIKTIDAKGNDKWNEFPPSKTLIHYLDGVTVSTEMYRPDVDALLFHKDGIDYINSYTPATIPAANDDWRAGDAWGEVKAHIENIIPEGADHVIKWWAHNVQHPGKKINWSPIIIGLQGDGKSSIGEMGQAAMGMRNVQTASAESVFSDYTDWAEGAAVRVLEEIRVQGNSRSTAMDKLKPFITNKTVDVVPKGRKGRNIVNVTNYFALSNHPDALAIDETDRRWAVWRTRFRTRAQLMEETGPAYFSRLHRALEDHAAIRGWLMSIDLSDFDRFSPPAITDAKLDMIEASRAPTHAAIMEAIELGGAGIGENIIAIHALREATRGILGKHPGPTATVNILREHGWQKFKGKVHWNGESRIVYYLGDPPASNEDVRQMLDDTDPDFGYNRPPDW